MKDNIKAFSKEIIDDCKSVSLDNAKRLRTEDTGFSTTISNKDIKKGLERDRLREPMLKKVVKEINSSGYEANITEDGIKIDVPPLLEKKDNFTLSELKERKKVIEQINTQDAFDLMNNN